MAFAWNCSTKEKLSKFYNGSTKGSRCDDSGLTSSYCVGLLASLKYMKSMK